MKSRNGGSARAPAVILVNILAFLLGVLISSKAAAGICTPEEARRAEYGASTLKTWEEVFWSYERYRSCDDGAISEGYSNSVATLLASKWNQVGDVVSLFETDRAFEAFVLRHIDDTMTRDQDVMIRRNIHKKCPEVATQFCAALSKRFAALNSTG